MNQENQDLINQPESIIESVEVTEESVSITSVEFTSGAPVRVIESFYLINGKLTPMLHYTATKSLTNTYSTVDGLKQKNDSFSKETWPFNKQIELI